LRSPLIALWILICLVVGRLRDAGILGLGAARDRALCLDCGDAGTSYSVCWWPFFIALYLLPLMPPKVNRNGELRPAKNTA
jgi:hypothetical protein